MLNHISNQRLMPYQKAVFGFSNFSLLLRSLRQTSLEMIHYLVDILKQHKQNNILYKKDKLCKNGNFAHCNLTQRHTKHNNTTAMNKCNREISKVIEITYDSTTILPWGFSLSSLGVIANSSLIKCASLVTTSSLRSSRN